MAEKQPATKRDRFELEALEPRLLLSADVLLVAALSQPAATSGTATGGSVIEVSAQGQEAIQSSLAYDPSAQVASIFETVADSSNAISASPDGQNSAAGSAQNTSLNGAAVVDNSVSNAVVATPTNSTTEVNPGAETVASDALTQQASSTLSTPTAASDLSASVVEDVAISNPIPDQLTQSLNGANSPPSADGVIASSSDGTTSIDQFRIVVNALQVELLDQQGLIVSSQTLGSSNEFVVFGDSTRDNVFIIEGAVLDVAAGLNIRIVGGQGHDTLQIDDHDGSTRQWNITGDNAGQVANVSFSSIEHLVGGANNYDTFTIAPEGVFNGVIEGGVGGFDSLVIYGVTHGSYTPGEVFGDGALVADQSQIQFTGLEPVTEVGTGAGSSYLFDTGNYNTGTGVGNDDLTIGTLKDTPGMNQISGTISGSPF